MEGLIAGVEYGFRVRAYGDGTVYLATWGLVSAVVVTSTPLPPPPAPTGMRLDEGVTFNRMLWDAVDGVARWQLERRGGGRSDWRVQGNPSTPGSALSKTSTVDYYRVRAYGDGITYAEVWSQPSEAVVGLPHEDLAFSFSPNRLALARSATCWLPIGAARWKSTRSPLSSTRRPTTAPK